MHCQGGMGRMQETRAGAERATQGGTANMAQGGLKLSGEEFQPAAVRSARAPPGWALHAHATVGV